jgi:alanine dehydrogenase
VFDEVTGAPYAVMGATYITAIRTAMTAALVARALARPQATSLAIIGAGVQAEAHLEAFTHLMALGDIRIASRHLPEAAEVAERHTGTVVASSVREAVDGADVVCCCTDAVEPVLAGGWIGPGTHVSSVGSGRELPAALLGRAQLFVESRAATAPPPADAVELQGTDPESLTEVGDVLAGRSGGQASAESVTVFKSTGHATEDVAAAAVVICRAHAAGAGIAVTMAS